MIAIVEIIIIFTKIVHKDIFPIAMHITPPIQKYKPTSLYSDKKEF